MATNMHGDIGPQGLLDHVESTLIAERRFLGHCDGGLTEVVVPLPASDPSGAFRALMQAKLRIEAEAQKMAVAPKSSGAPGLFHIMTPSGPRCGDDGRPLAFRYDRNRDSWVANHTHPYSHIITHDYLQRQVGWVLVKVGEEFDPPPAVTFTGPGGVSGQTLKLKGFDEHNNEKVEWVGEEKAPEPEAPRSSMAADDFDQIRRRMEEIRAAEGRQAPA